MKQGWEIQSLGDIGKVSMCKRILKRQTTTDGDIPFYKIGTFGKIPNAFITNEVYEEYRSKYSFPQKGDILISASGTIGRRVIYDGKPAYFQDSNIVWIANDETKVLNDYLYIFYDYCDWNPSRGATISRLYNDDLRRIKIPIPPLPEQKRIVAKLDQAFEALDQAKANVERNLQNAKELFQSQLQSVTDSKERLGNLVDIITGKLNANQAVENGHYPFFTCSREIYKIDNYAYDLEAILLAGNNASGDFNVKHYSGKFNAYQRTYIISIKDEMKLLYRFLYYQMLNSLSGLKRQSVGVGTKFLKLPVIKDFKISCPPLSEQKLIVKQLDNLLEKSEQLKSSYKVEIDTLNNLKKSILQKAFNGEL